MRLRIGLLLALLLTLAPAASAHAQADFNGTLSGANPKFTWESVGSGAPSAGDARCAGGIFNCEYVLFKIEDAGALALTLESPEGTPVQGVPDICEDEPCASFQDLDGYLYKSDASGAPQGETMTDGDAEAGEPDCSTSFASESCKVPVEPGYYVLEVEFFLAYEAPYKGTAELLGAAAPAAPAAPAETPTEPPAQGQQQPQPQQQPAQSAEPKKKSSAKQRRAACTKKAKKIKNKRKRAKALKRCRKIR